MRRRPHLLYLSHLPAWESDRASGAVPTRQARARISVEVSGGGLSIAVGITRLTAIHIARHAGGGHRPVRQPVERSQRAGRAMDVSASVRDGIGGRALGT